MDSEAYIEINEKGHIVFDGCDVVDLAKEYGTPLYVISESEIRRRCSRVRKQFMDKYPDTLALYASKAMSSIALYKIIGEEGLGIDVVSGGELYTAIKAGFPMERVYFHGTNKTEAEIKLGIENDVGCFVVDNEYELEMLQRMASERGRKVKALLRIAPGVSGHTHEYISTGQVDSKFGFSIKDDTALNAVKEVLG
ncbi:MAG: diaminopimelate decarboxylase, partial [Clostridiaceae bacterium]|nr:diaminopimelate decarboxylase [Clostridiaceae bacterium]